MNLHNAIHLITALQQKKITAETDSTLSNSQYLALLPTDYSADYAHSTLHHLEAFVNYIQHKRLQPYHADGSELTAEQQLNLRHFSQKLEDLSTKFIVKVANHYKSAQLTPVVMANPFGRCLKYRFKR